QAFADLHAGDARGDRLQFPLNLRRRVGLGIEGLMLRRRAEGEQENAGLGFAERRGGSDRFAGQRLQSQGITQTQAKHPQSADMQQIAAAKAVAKRLSRTAKSEHCRASWYAVTVTDGRRRLLPRTTAKG